MLSYSDDIKIPGTRREAGVFVSQKGRRHFAGTSSGCASADGSRPSPRAESASGRAWNSRTGTPYIRRIGRWTLTLSARLSVLFAVSFTPEQAAPKPSRASSAVMILAFIFLVLSVTFLAEFTDKYMHNFAFFHESVQKTSQKVLTFNCFYFTLPDKSIILFL